jgi:hypothetical protein
MTGSYRLVLGAGAALALLVAAAPDLRAQQFTGTAFTTPSLFATVTLGAATASGSGIGYANPQDRFCGSPFDVRFGSWSPWYGTRWSAWYGRPFGFRFYGSPYGRYGSGYGSYGSPYGGSYGWPYDAWSPFGAAPPCHAGLRTGWWGPYLFYDGYGFYVASRWLRDPWAWGFGYDSWLSHGYGWNPKSGYRALGGYGWTPYGYGWTPYGYGYAPYGTNRALGLHPRQPRRDGNEDPGVASAPDEGRDAATRVGPAGIRTGGADLRRVRLDGPTVRFLEPGPSTPADGSAGATGATTAPPAPAASREAIADALARSRAELAARRIEVSRSAPGGAATARPDGNPRSPEVQNPIQPLRRPEVYRPVQPLRSPEVQKPVQPRSPEVQRPVQPLRRPEVFRPVQPRSPEVRRPVEPVPDLSRSRTGVSGRASMPPRASAPPRSFASPPRAQAPSPRAVSTPGARKSGKSRD